MAIVFVIRYLFGRRFHCLRTTDLSPCCLVLNLVLLCRPHSAFQNWAIQLSAHQYGIDYRASKNNSNADALSQLPGKTVEELDDGSIEADQVNCVQMEWAPITLSQIRKTSRGNPVVSYAMYCIFHGLPAENSILKIYYRQQDEFTVEDGCILRVTKVVIPSKYQAVVLLELHLNHLGMLCMNSQARLHVQCPSRDQDVEQTVRDCKSLYESSESQKSLDLAQTTLADNTCRVGGSV